MLLKSWRWFVDDSLDLRRSDHLRRDSRRDWFRNRFRTISSSDNKRIRYLETTTNRTNPKSWSNYSSSSIYLRIRSMLIAAISQDVDIRRCRWCCSSCNRSTEVEFLRVENSRINNEMVGQLRQCLSTFDNDEYYRRWHSTVRLIHTNCRNGGLCLVERCFQWKDGDKPEEKYAR